MGSVSSGVSKTDNVSEKLPCSPADPTLVIAGLDASTY